MANKEGKGGFGENPQNINIEGRPEGSGISITTEIKRKLQEVPEGRKKTYLQLIVDKIVHKKALVDGDYSTIKQIWNYIDGMPKQKHEIDQLGTQVQNNILQQIILIMNDGQQQEKKTGKDTGKKLLSE